MARPGLRVNPKYRRLVVTLGLPEPHVYGLLEFMWSVGYETGNPLLGDGRDVELAAGWTGKPGELLEALVACRFLDQLEGGYAIHDLFDHCPEYVHGRAQREQERKKQKHCRNCKASFHSPELHAAYCSPACRQAAYRLRTVTDGDEGVRNTASIGKRRGSARSRRDSVTRVTQSDGPPAPIPPRAHPAPAPAPGASRGKYPPRTPSCPEPDEPASGPPVAALDESALLVFPTAGKVKAWGLSAAKVSELRAAFPALDVVAECRKALAWLQANPTRTKTSNGMGRFLFGWMDRSQNSGRNGRVQPTDYYAGLKAFNAKGRKE
jgi:hypothetical protein